MNETHVFIDGAARGNPGPAGLGVIFEDGQGRVLGRIRRYLGRTTNNVAEYQALLEALREAIRRGWRRLIIHTDSQLLQQQIQGGYRVRSRNLLPLYKEARRLLSRLEDYDILHVPRQHNKEADRLANEAIDGVHSGS
jgi:ribonuclease HI